MIHLSQEMRTDIKKGMHACISIISHKFEHHLSSKLFLKKKKAALMTLRIHEENPATLQTLFGVKHLDQIFLRTGNSRKNINISSHFSHVCF